MTMLLLDREFDHTALSSVDELDIRNIKAKDWKLILTAEKVVRLRLYHLMAPTLPELDRLISVRCLSMTWATKISSIEPVFRMARLTSLTISDFPKLQDLIGVAELSALTDLHLSGNLGSLNPPLKLASIAPVVELPFLKTLSLLNAKLGDDDITVLAACRSLERLDLSNQFEKSQFAYLAKHLNPQLKEPIKAHSLTSLDCKVCGGKMSLVTGRRAPMLCGSCDRTRLAKADEQFAKLVAEA